MFSLIMTTTLRPPQPAAARTARRALVVDDHPVVAAAVADRILAMRAFERVDSANSLAEAFRLLEGDAECSLVVLDLQLGAMKAEETIRGMRERFPDVPVLVFSADSSMEHITLAFECGVRGYVTKSAPSHVLGIAIQLVLGGGSYIPPEAAQLAGLPAMPQASVAASASPVRFSVRQEQVLRLLLQGMPNKVIAARLGMAEGTAKAHLNAVFRELGVQTRLQAVLRSRELGLI